MKKSSRRTFREADTLEIKVFESVNLSGETVDISSRDINSVPVPAKEPAFALLSLLMDALSFAPRPPSSGTFFHVKQMPTAI